MNIRVILVSITATIFLVIALYSAVSDYLTNKQRVDDIETVQQKLDNIDNMNEVIVELQRERGISIMYYDNRDKEHTLTFKAQKKNTNYYIKRVSNVVNTKYILVRRAEILDKIEKKSIAKLDAFKDYNRLLSHLLKQSKKLTYDTENIMIKNSLMYYNDLNNMQEELGQIRGLIGSALNTYRISREEYKEIIILNKNFKEHFKDINDDISLKIDDKQVCMVSTYEVISKIVSNKLFSINIKPFIWYEMATCSVEMVNDSVSQEMMKMKIRMKKSYKEAKKRALVHNAIWLVGILMLITTFFLFTMLLRKLAREKKLHINYKNVIDNSKHSIVSKTDKKGIITYVNDPFCVVSKYPREELIGKPHNIVRHPDVPKEVFKEFWATIKSGKTWSGVVKNRCKDGTPYWVDASVSPIYDEKHELIEYIAIRHDITDLIVLNEEIETTQRELIYRMGEAVESRSKESGNHVRRVAHYSQLLARLSGMNEADSDLIFTASTMHDMGKIAIPDSILLKSDKLTGAEYNIMKQHAQIGYELLSGSTLPILKMASMIAYEHHEHFNGYGYPLKKKGTEISVEARIVAIVDVFDALISDRVYKKAWSLDKVIETLEDGAGKQFDPILIELFLDNVSSFMEIKEKFEDSIDHVDQLESKETTTEEEEREE